MIGAGGATVRDRSERPRHSDATAVVGLGTAHGDDQVGWVVVDRLHSRLTSGVSAHKIATELDLIDVISDLDYVIIVDASAPRSQPGVVRWFTWPCQRIEEVGLLSTHGFGLVAALRLAEALGSLPGRVVVYAVEAQAVTPGQPLSPAVSSEIASVVEAIAREVTEWPSPGDEPCTRRP
jgi:hydrogenase maturation protease